MNKTNIFNSKRFRMLGAAAAIVAGAALLFVSNNRLSLGQTAGEPSQATLQQDFTQLGTMVRPDMVKLDRSVFQPDVLRSQSKLMKLAPANKPILRDLVNKFDSFSTQHPEVAGLIRPQSSRIKAVLVAMGEKQATGDVAKAMAGKDAKAKLNAQLINLQVAWWRTPDAAGQKTLVADAKGMAKAHSASDNLAMTVAGMMGSGTANKAIHNELQDIILNDLNGQAAMAMQQQLKPLMMLHKLVGKPITVSGIELDGSHFSTAKWKGKVVVVDFWATWCGPCRASLPSLEALYAKDHAKGLEVVGVSSDQHAAALSSFLKSHKAMTWPQIFDKAHPGWSPIAASFGIDAIPTQFVIDRAGVVRKVSQGYAPGNALEVEVSKLLAEK